MATVKDYEAWVAGGGPERASQNTIATPDPVPDWQLFANLAFTWTLLAVLISGLIVLLHRHRRQFEPALVTGLVHLARFGRGICRKFLSIVRQVKSGLNDRH